MNPSAQRRRKLKNRANANVVASVLLLASLLIAPSQMVRAAAADAGDDKPVDIQAQQQEFIGDQIVAKGNVTVTYKDVVVKGPNAQMFRGPDGQAQKAIFTGHPHLVQGHNKMDADTLVFQLASGEVTAEGRAHSEVSSDGPGTDEAAEKKAADEKRINAMANGQLKEDPDKPEDSSDGTKAADQAPAADGPATSSTASGAKKKVVKPIKDSHAQAPEMIITDSDHQDYAKDGGKFQAHGHVHLKTGDIVVHSERLVLVYGTDGKPESAVFNGTVDATQFENNTKSDMMTYYLSTQRLQATGNVKSRVIQKKEEPKKGGPPPPMRTSEGDLDPGAIGDIPDDDIIILNADAQDFVKDTGRISAQGNVHLIYGDIKGWGPNVLVLRNDEGLVDRVLFRGRSEIDQPGKRWIGDRISLTCTDKKVLAEGNTRAIILQNAPKKSPALTVPGPDGQILAKKQADIDAQNKRTPLKEPTPAPPNPQLATKGAAKPQ